MDESDVILGPYMHVHILPHTCQNIQKYLKTQNHSHLNEENVCNSISLYFLYL